MNKQVKQNQNSATEKPNYQAQLRAEEGENPAQDAGGALAAAPCSALSDRLLGQSDIIGPAPDGWDKIAKSNSKSLEELTKK